MEASSIVEYLKTFKNNSRVFNGTYPILLTNRVCPISYGSTSKALPNEDPIPCEDYGYSSAPDNTVTITLEHDGEYLNQITTVRNIPIDANGRTCYGETRYTVRLIACVNSNLWWRIKEGFDGAGGSLYRYGRVDSLGNLIGLPDYYTTAAFHYNGYMDLSVVCGPSQRHSYTNIITLFQWVTLDGKPTVDLRPFKNFFALKFGCPVPSDPQYIENAQVQYDEYCFNSTFIKLKTFVCIGNTSGGTSYGITRSDVGVVSSPNSLRHIPYSYYPEAVAFSDDGTVISPFSLQSIGDLQPIYDEYFNIIGYELLSRYPEAVAFSDDGDIWSF